MRLSPSRQTERAALGALPFAHRGLHGPGIVENSRAAFEAAIAAGFGIELDVQPSRDAEAMVFHDDNLERLTSAQGPVADRNAAELRALSYRGGPGTIPDLTEVLRLVAGRVPVLIELKAPDRHVTRLCLAVFRALDGYRGAVAIMSFNPEVCRWFARHAPRRLRGLVVTESGKKGLRGRVERALGFWRASPDFLAYDIRDLPSRFAARRRSKGVSVFTWTVRSAADRARAAVQADQIIFETQSA
jgi:glycerophosphoryl diester phosphodiesterase